MNSQEVQQQVEVQEVVQEVMVVHVQLVLVDKETMEDLVEDNLAVVAVVQVLLGLTDQQQEVEQVVQAGYLILVVLV
jgi:hypothetical protein